MRKAKIYSAIGLVVAVGSIYAVSNTYAQEKLFGGNVSEEVRQEHIAEREAERAQAVIQAMDEGNISPRQAEILTAMAEIRPAGGRGIFGAGKELTAEERETLRAQMREEKSGSMLETLNEVLDESVTHEELEELRELREELGLMGNQNRRGGGIGGQGTGECPNL